MTDPKKRRTILLVDKKFQIRFCVYICAAVGILSIVYPFIVHRLFILAQELVMRLAPAGASTPLQEAHQEVVFLLALFQVVFILVVAMISFFLSHRIAGPIYRVKKGLEALAAGNLDERIRLRDKDHFQDLADAFNKTAEALQKRNMK